MQEIVAKSRSLIVQHGIKIILIDHIQLMGVTKGRSRNEEISEISAGLKNLARDGDLVVGALSQLSRECEKRSPPRPMLSDLRDSGSIEQDADRVVFIYRGEVYNRADAEKGIAEIIIAKNRNGRTGMVKTLFDGNSMQFKSLTKRDEQPDRRDDWRND
jgi:replicative DNA helicase